MLQTRLTESIVYIYVMYIYQLLPPFLGGLSDPFRGES